MFIHAVPLRSNIEPDTTGSEFIRRFKTTLAEAEKHSRAYALHVESAQLYDVMIVYQDPDFNLHALSGMNDLNLTAQPVFNNFSRLPLTFNFFEQSGQIRSMIEFDPSVIAPADVNDLKDRYEKLIQLLIDNSYSFSDGSKERRTKEEQMIEIDLNF